LQSTNKFLKKIVNYFENIEIGKSSASIESKLNKAIKLITQDVETMKYNLAVIKLRQLFESIEDSESVSKKTLESFLKMFSIFCPHLGEELWEKIGEKEFLSLASWPVADESKINEKLERAEMVVDQTVRDIMNILRIIGERGEKGEVGEKVYVYAMPFEKEYFDENKISERIGKEVKIFAVNDKNKYDPKGIAKKSKPGKPGIYVE
jgi:leucyl-tRNA synthetase